jgi:hypothetical protein
MFVVNETVGSSNTDDFYKLSGLLKYTSGDGKRAISYCITEGDNGY